MNTSVSLSIAMATSLTPSSRSPSALVLTLASYRTHIIARIVPAIDLMANRTMSDSAGTCPRCIGRGLQQVGHEVVADAGADDVEDADAEIDHARPLLLTE